MSLNKLNYISSLFNVSLIKGESNGLFSDMGLDDVKLDYGECPSFSSCTFENADLCFWTNVQDNRDKFDWEIGSSETKTAGTGPR
jgi:hypothetical protein